MMNGFSSRLRTIVYMMCGAALAGLAIPPLAFDLITRQEAARQDDPFRPERNAGIRGPFPEPEIRIYGNTVTTSPFNLVIELRPGAKSARINLNSLAVTYRKQPPVDLKPRIERFIDSSGRVVVIKLEGAQAPVGKHQILFQVEDSNELMTSKVVDLDVRSSN
jgi:hypothetical protein